MDTLNRELVDIREEFIPEMPEMLLGVDSSTNRIKGKLGCPLTFWGDGPIVDEEVKTLSIFALKHHFKLLQASALVISFIGVDVKGFQVVKSPGVEDPPVLLLIRGIKIEFRNFPAGVWVRCHVTS